MILGRQSPSDDRPGGAGLRRPPVEASPDSIGRPNMRAPLRLLSAVGVLSFWLLAAPHASALTAQKLTFRAPVFVDSQLAGSEGFVMYAAKSHRLVYATHE